MCCSVIVDILIRVSSKAYSNTCGCLFNEFQLTPFSSQLHEQTVPVVKITCDIVLVMLNLSLLLFVGLQAATRSPQCSVMLKRSYCVLAVPQSSVSLREGKLASQKVWSVHTCVFNDNTCPSVQNGCGLLSCIHIVMV